MSASVNEWSKLLSPRERAVWREASNCERPADICLRTPVLVKHRQPRTDAKLKRAAGKLTGMEIEISLGTARIVSGLLQKPPRARACYVFAHGAGAGMTHSFMTAVAAGLFNRDIATLRYQFPYTQKGSKRPDSPSVAHEAVRAAVAEAWHRCPGLPLFAGGKSFGGRMTSQAQALHPLPEVRGLSFFGFPLHPPGKPSEERAKHLFDIKVPMLFLQGGRDKLAELLLMERLIGALGKRSSLRVFEYADHSFHVPARSGTNDREVMRVMLEDVAAWMLRLV
jgi:uncharacterized protein